MQSSVSIGGEDCTVSTVLEIHEWRYEGDESVVHIEITDSEGRKILYLKSNLYWYACDQHRTPYVQYMCFIKDMTLKKFCEITGFHKFSDLEYNEHRKMLEMVKATVLKSEKLDGLGWYLEKTTVKENFRGDLNDEIILTHIDCENDFNLRYL